MKQIFLISSLLLLTSGCTCSKSSKTIGSSQETLAPKDSTSITIGISQEPDSLFQPFKEMMASSEVLGLGTYTLTQYDENWKLVPWAAKSIPTQKNGGLIVYEENGQTKMRATWQIRDDFFWPDGTPLTGDDFLLSHEIYIDPKQEVIDRSVDDKIEKMEVRGENRKTLIVTWKESYAYYHAYGQHGALPNHIIRSVFENSPQKLKKHAFGRRPMLAGGYSIEEWVPGNYVRALRNPKTVHPDRNPVLDEVIFKIIPQTNTLESNLVSGSIDAISPTGLNLDQALQFEKRYGDQFDFHYVSGLLWEHIDFNLDNPILKDLRVRQALAHGANREGIANALFKGRQPVAHGTEPPKSQYHNDNIKKYPYDPVKAGKLLDAAGWKRGNPSAIRMKEGEKLSLILMTTSGNKTREKIEQLLQAQWRQLGVDIQIQNQPAKVFFGDTMHRRKYTGLAMYSWIKDPLALSDTLWRCDYIPSKKNNWMGQNQPGWCNKEAHNILLQASQELDDAKRIALGKRFEEIWAEELPALPLYFRVSVSVTKKGLKNWKPTGMSQPMTWNAHKWAWAGN